MADPYLKRLKLVRVKMSGAPVIFYPLGTPAVRLALHFVLVLNDGRLPNRFRVFWGWKRWMWRELPLAPWTITIQDAESIDLPQDIVALEEA